MFVLSLAQFSALKTVPKFCCTPVSRAMINLESVDSYSLYVSDNVAFVESQIKTGQPIEIGTVLGLAYAPMTLITDIGDWKERTYSHAIAQRPGKKTLDLVWAAQALNAIEPTANWQIRSGALVSDRSSLDSYAVWAAARNSYSAAKLDDSELLILSIPDCQDEPTADTQIAERAERPPRWVDWLIGMALGIGLSFAWLQQLF